MKIVGGQTPRGKNFFQREKLMKLLYRRLSTGSNIYMAAPRRVGKTAILRYLEDNPRDDYHAVYIVTESVDDTQTFFKTVLDELFKSEAIGKLKKLSNKSSEVLNSMLGRLKSLGGFGVNVELEAAKTDFYAEYKTLVKKLDDTSGLKLIIMLDEFPQTVENILRKHGESEAIRFLQLNREIRQEASANIAFMLTGSIGLPTLTEKLSATKTINDLNVFEVPPFERDEAREMTTLLLKSEKIPYEPQAIEYLLDKLSWLSPYFLQLLVQEFADEYDIKGRTVTIAAVDEAFVHITDRRNDANFAHYYERLRKTFLANELAFALAFLNALSQQEALALPEIKALADSQQLAEQYPFVLRTLEFDGYVFKNQPETGLRYCFTSPLVKLWWSKYVLR